jgi:hypothetical protein
VCVYVCERERERRERKPARERKRGRERKFNACACVCVDACTPLCTQRTLARRQEPLHDVLKN